MMAFRREPMKATVLIIASLFMMAALAGADAALALVH